MGNSLVKIDIHLIFHIKSTGIKLYESDLNDIFAYIGDFMKLFTMRDEEFICENCGSELSDSPDLDVFDDDDEW